MKKIAIPSLLLIAMLSDLTFALDERKVFRLGAIDMINDGCPNLTKSYIDALAELGFRAELSTPPYSRMYKMLEKGRLDGLVVGGYSTAQKSENMVVAGDQRLRIDFLLYRNKKFKDTKTKDLNIVIPLGVRFAIAGLAEQVKTIDRVSSFAIALEMVDRGRADATVMPDFVYNLVNNNQSFENIMSSVEPIISTRMHNLLYTRHANIAKTLGDYIAKKLASSAYQPVCKF